MSKANPAKTQAEELSAPVGVEQKSADPDTLKTDVKEQQAAVASPQGGSDQYPYVDKTQTPVHERFLQVNSTTEASQAELNPAFTPKPEDGGPVHPVSGEGIGTEPNAVEVVDAKIETAQDAAKEQADGLKDAKDNKDK